MNANDPVIAAAAILLGLVPGQHAQSAHQLPPAPGAPPIHCESGWDHDCKAWAGNHLVIRWVGNQPASAPHGVTMGHADPHRLSVIRQTDPNAPDPPRHHRRHHHHRRGHHHR